MPAKYYEEYRKGTNVVPLHPDVAEAFPMEGAVNEALRGFSVRRAVISPAPLYFVDNSQAFEGTEGLSLVWPGRAILSRIAERDVFERMFLLLAQTTET